MVVAALISVAVAAALSGTVGNLMLSVGLGANLVLLIVVAVREAVAERELHIGAVPSGHHRGAAGPGRTGASSG